MGYRVYGEWTRKWQLLFGGLGFMCLGAGRIKWKRNGENEMETLGPYQTPSTQEDPTCKAL